MRIKNCFKAGGQLSLSISVLILLTIFFSGCSPIVKKQGAALPATPAEPTVVVAKVLKKTVPIYVEFIATIDPSASAEKVDIKARVEAELMSQHFKEGKIVKKGDLLFTLDDSMYRANLRSAWAAYDKAKADYEYAKGQVDVTRAKASLDSAKAQRVLANTNLKRIKPLAEQKAVPQQDLDNAETNQKVAEYNVAANKAIYDTTVLQQKIYIQQAQAEMENALANIDKAKINLGYCTITSPITGIAGTRLVAPGNLVGRGEATLLTTVTDLDPLRINFNVSENDYLALMEKRKGKGKTPDSFPDIDLYLSDNTKYQYSGKVSISDQVFDSKTGTMLLVAVFPNPNYLLRPGMFGRLRFIVDYKKNSILVPQKAVVVIQDSRTIYVVDKDNKVALRSLKLGRTYGNMYIVEKGLKPDDVVIVEGQLKVHAGMKVKPVYKALTSERGVK